MTQSALKTKPRVSQGKETKNSSMAAHVRHLISTSWHAFQQLLAFKYAQSTWDLVIPTKMQLVNTFYFSFLIDAQVKTLL